MVAFIAVFTAANVAVLVALLNSFLHDVAIIWVGSVIAITYANTLFSISKERHNSMLNFKKIMMQGMSILLPVTDTNDNLWRRLAWFGGLWLASVLTLSVVAYAIKLML